MMSGAVEQCAHSWALAEAGVRPQGLQECPPLPTPWLGTSALQTVRGEVSVVLGPQPAASRLSSHGARAGSSVWAASTVAPPPGQ